MMAFFELIFYSLNEAIGVDAIKIHDIGGSMVIHAFGAYFGLAVSTFFDGKETKKNKNIGSDYNSNLIAAVGTIFLFCFWPSFNGALATGDF